MGHYNEQQSYKLHDQDKDQQKVKPLQALQDPLKLVSSQAHSMHYGQCGSQDCNTLPSTMQTSQGYHVSPHTSKSNTSPPLTNQQA